MGLEKVSIVSKIEYIAESLHIQVQAAHKIMEDGVELSRTYHRHVLSPGDDLAGEDAQVVAIANAVWTPDTLAAFHERAQAQEIRPA